MSRNTHFTPDREPLRENDALQLNGDKIHGPVSFLNPTQASFTPVSPVKTNAYDAPDAEKYDAYGDDVEYKWTSRNNRKGRHALVIKPANGTTTQSTTPPPSTSSHEILRDIWRMCTYFPVWDVSYLVAVTFTLGSVLWVLNSFFVFLPLIEASTEFPGEVILGGGITAFIGVNLFQLGSIFLMLEAVNENRAGCFGWAIEQLYDQEFGRGEKGMVTKVTPDKRTCTHHHPNKKNLIGKPAQSNSTTTSPTTTRSWTWWPTTHELRTHYLHDIGFLACSFQTVGATIFYISGVTALPGIYNNLSPAALIGAYWTPQIVGGVGFIISGTLFMLETQQKWWQPAFGTLGWHIGVWNLIGGVGFTLCPVFGFDPAGWAQYQAACATFWGSWAFLIGSALQWYESLNKYPVEVDKTAGKRVE